METLSAEDSKRQTYWFTHQSLDGIVAQIESAPSVIITEVNEEVTTGGQHKVGLKPVKFFVVVEVFNLGQEFFIVKAVVEAGHSSRGSCGVLMVAAVLGHGMAA